MTNQAKLVKGKVLQKRESLWWMSAYKYACVSSILDDWHPDVYKNFDPKKWVELIASMGPDVAWIQSKSHSGNAYYKTELDHTNIGLRGRDAFGDLLELFHKRGIKVVANQSILFDNYLYKNHPDWRIRNAEGKDSKELGIGYARPGVLCFNSPYKDLALSQVEAFVKKYPIDGIFFDMVWIWIPVCYCQYCQKLYQKECECELPAKDDRLSPAFRQYVHWRNQKLYQFTRELVNTVRAHHPEGLVFFQSPRPYKGYPAVLERALLEDTVAGDPCQNDMSPLSVSFGCNVFSNMAVHPPAHIALGRFHAHEGQHTGMRSLDELMVTAMLCLAYNCSIEAIDTVNVDGTLYESHYRTFKKVFDAMRVMEPFVGGEKIRSVGIYISEETKDFFYETGNEYTLFEWDDRKKVLAVDEYTSGLLETFRSFQQHHVPVDLITKLDLEKLNQYALIVVPEALCMSNKEAEYMRSYVQEGGNLLATRFTSLADENGNLRHNFALADVFGVEFLGETENDETYIKVPPDLCRRAEIPEDMEVKVDRQAIVRAHPNTKTMGHIVLPYTNRANDADRWVGCWGSPPGIVSDHPALVMNRYGKGQCCYCAARIHSLNGLVSVEEPRELLYTLGRSMLNELLPLWVDGPACLIVTGFRKPEEKCIIVHTVNAQQEMPIFTLTDIAVELQLSDAEKVRSVILYPQKKPVKFQQEGNRLYFSIPEIKMYEVSVIELT